MNEKNIFNVQDLIAAIKEVAAVIAENGGADIKAYVKEIDNRTVAARIIIEPYNVLEKREARNDNIT